MKIKYIVGKYENSVGQIHELQRKEFDSVEEAIEYRKQQTNGWYSWWEIRVVYE